MSRARRLARRAWAARLRRSRWPALGSACGEAGPSSSLGIGGNEARLGGSHGAGGGEARLDASRGSGGGEAGAGASHGSSGVAADHRQFYSRRGYFRLFFGGICWLFTPPNHVRPRHAREKAKQATVPRLIL